VTSDMAEMRHFGEEGTDFAQITRMILQKSLLGSLLPKLRPPTETLIIYPTTAADRMGLRRTVVAELRAKAPHNPPYRARRFRCADVKRKARGRWPDVCGSPSETTSLHALDYVGHCLPAQIDAETL
jgi:hypothetical protein